jgi:hypothetical protein
MLNTKKEYQGFCRRFSDYKLRYSDFFQYVVSIGLDNEGCARLIPYISPLFVLFFPDSMEYPFEFGGFT